MMAEPKVGAFAESQFLMEPSTAPTSPNLNVPAAPVSGGECPLCHSPEMILPYVTGCNHTFCYLCLKAAYERDPCCPICRAVLSADFYENAKLPAGTVSPTTGPFWLYQGRLTGWWKYDTHTNRKIEEGYQRYVSSLAQKQEPTTETSPPESDSDDEVDGTHNHKNIHATMSVVIMNKTYTIDFERMTQTPVIAWGVTRGIQRIVGDGQNILVKGTAGLQNPRPVVTAPVSVSKDAEETKELELIQDCSCRV